MLQLNKNIKLIRELSGKKQPEFADLIGTNLSNLKTYETTDVKPKGNILAKVADIASVTVEDLEEKKLSHKDIKINNILLAKVEKVDSRGTSTIHVNEDSQGKNKNKGLGRDKKSDKIIEDLAASSKDHAAADLKRAEAEFLREQQNILREQNHKRIIDHITESAHVENQIAFETILPGLRELLVDLGMETHWKSRDEGAKAVRNVLYGGLQKKKAKGTQNG